MKQCESVIEGHQCIYVDGHRREHYAPQDGRDHSEEIRVRMLSDKCEELTERIRAFETATLELRRAWIATPSIDVKLEALACSKLFALVEGAK